MECVTSRTKYFILKKITAEDNAMTLTLELSGNKEAALKARARIQGVSAEQFLQRIVDRELEQKESPAAAPAKRRISERIAEIMADVPAEEFSSFPRTAHARLTITFTACPREISAAGFRGYVLLDRSAQCRRSGSRCRYRL